MDLCLEVDRHLRGRVDMRWWEQEGMMFVGARRVEDMEMEGASDL